MRDIFLENKKNKKNLNLADRAFNLFAYTIAGSCICISIFFIVLSIMLLRS